MKHTEEVSLSGAAADSSGSEDGDTLGEDPVEPGGDLEEGLQAGREPDRQEELVEP